MLKTIAPMIAAASLFASSQALSAPLPDFPARDAAVRLVPEARGPTMPDVNSRIALERVAQNVDPKKRKPQQKRAVRPPAEKPVQQRAIQPRAVQPRSIPQQPIQRQVGQPTTIQRTPVQQQSASPQGINQQQAVQQKLMQQRAAQQKAIQQKAAYQKLLQQQGVRTNVQQQKLMQQQAVQQRSLQQQLIRQRMGANRLGAGPGRAGMTRATLGHAHLARIGNNRIAPVYRDQRRYWHRGAWRRFVPLAALGVVFVGGTYLYADGYLSVGRQYCDGVTPDGCHLNWRTVEFEDGGEEWQCVQYCPRPGAMPPPRTVALVAPPPAPQGRCEISIFSEPNFGSPPVTTGEDQEYLSDSGWRDQIASLEVKAGVWEVFTDEQFGGESMRLNPGRYPALAPDFDRKIASFMCVQPGN